MRFIDITSFNLALLSKQGWRLLTQPHSLTARVIEAKYYALGEFQTAQLGHQPSYIWRSILVARPYVIQGVW